MSHQIPLEIAAIIVDYVADAQDIATLKNLALTSQDFCALGQARIFSTVLLDGSARGDRLIFFEHLLNSDRGQIIAGYIKNLYLLFCDDWFAEEEEEDGPELTHEHEQDEADDPDQELAEKERDPGGCSMMIDGVDDDSTADVIFGTMIEFIAKHAKILRCIHIGPFCEIHLDWHDISDNVRFAIAQLLISAEEIALEDFVNIPVALFQNMQNVKSLDVSHVIAMPSYHTKPPPFIPSPTSLAIHPGINGFSVNSDEMWDMTSFLRQLFLGTYMNFSNLNTLYLHLLDDPHKNLLIKQLLALCADSLRTLRLYIWDRRDYDGHFVDLSQLPALESLTLVTDFPGARLPFRYLSEAINTISTQQIHLNELMLAIDKEDRFRDWTLGLAFEVQSILDQSPDHWETLLKTNISRILQKSKARISFKFPPWPLLHTALRREEVINAIGDMFSINRMENVVRERLTFGIQEVSIKTAFTLRTEAEIRAARVSAIQASFEGGSEENAG